MNKSYENTRSIRKIQEDNRKADAYDGLVKEIEVWERAFEILAKSELCKECTLEPCGYFGCKQAHLKAAKSQLGGE